MTDLAQEIALTIRESVHLEGDQIKLSMIQETYNLIIHIDEIPHVFAELECLMLCDSVDRGGYLNSNVRIMIFGASRQF